jgi:hypothetical protein
VKSLRFSLSLITVFCCLVADGQQEIYPVGGPIPGSRIRENELRASSGKLRVTVSLDQQEYLPGEAAEVTISIANPTSRPLEVFEPFKTATGGFWIDAQRGPGKNPQYYPTEPDCCYALSTAPTRWFAAGETITRTFRLSDTRAQGEIGGVQVPKGPGSYRLYFLYDTLTPVNFTVIPASLSLDAYVPLQTGGQYTIGEKTSQFQRRVPIAVVDAGGKHYVIASLKSQGSPILRDARGTALPGWQDDLAPYVRVSSHDQPIVSLSGIERAQSNGVATNASASPQGQENLLLSWTTADGKQLTANLGPDRKPAQ